MAAVCGRVLLMRFALLSAVGWLATYSTPVSGRLEHQASSVSPIVVRRSMLPSGWRGLGMCPQFHCQDATTLDVSWFYTWHSDHPCPGQTLVPWVPMIFNAAHVKDAARLKGSGADALLGFNEPDCANQGNVTVAEALDLWPQLMATGLRLGSPAPASFTNGTFTWLKQFVDGVRIRGLRLDFLAVHFYLYRGQTIGDFRRVISRRSAVFSLSCLCKLRVGAACSLILLWRTRARRSFMAQLKSTYPGWKVWITETSVTPGGNGPLSAPPAEQIAYMNAVYEIITQEYSDVVERFAWVSTGGLLTVYWHYSSCSF